jgi:transcriptional regulator with XRE-family HTH domain
MNNFGEKLRQCRTKKKLSQSQLAKQLNTNHSLIGKYEREEVVPKIDAVIRIAKLLDTTVGFLLGETEQVNIFEDPTMLERLNVIHDFPSNDKSCILYALDAMIRDVKARQAYS